MKKFHLILLLLCLVGFLTLNSCQEKSMLTSSATNPVASHSKGKTTDAILSTDPYWYDNNGNGNTHMREIQELVHLLNFSKSQDRDNQQFHKEFNECHQAAMKAYSDRQKLGQSDNTAQPDIDVCICEWLKKIWSISNPQQKQIFKAWITAHPLLPTCVFGSGHDDEPPE